jgi:type IV pilus assembly protein PilO
MNWIEQMRRLDPRDVGRWPFLFRIAAIGVVFLLAFGFLFYVFVWTGNVPDLDKARAEQQSLWATFDEKQGKAANLEAYKQQLAEIERSFGAMLRQLPGKTEVPNLLVDISQTGLAAGLRERLFQPGGEARKEFYAELPIKIRLTGNYHEFGEFVSGIAALPRIVTLHDIQIARPNRSGGGDGDSLQLDVTAKTYRYLEESELQEQRAAESQPKSRKGRKKKR